MKKLLFAFLAVSLLTITSCKDDDPLTVAVWAVTYDWHPLETPFGDGTTIVTFKSDNKFSTSGGSSGSWTQTDNNLSWTYANGGNAAYSGIIVGDSMTGTIIDKNLATGEFKAIKN